MPIERRVLERLNALRPDPAPVGSFRHQIRDVVLLSSSSRGGSSITAEILRRSRDLLHFRAEVNVFLHLSGHVYPQSGTGSDQLGADNLKDPDLLEHLLAWDIGRPLTELKGGAAVERFAREVHWRLSVQWPLEEFALDWVLDSTQQIMSDLQTEPGWQEGRFVEPTIFWFRLLRALRSRHPGVGSWAYDLPQGGRRPANSVLRAPSPVLVEEPPLVILGPWEHALPMDLDKPLVIKTPSNAYRLPFFRALFPNARLRILHLTRNPAASINGLVDGWNYPGFHSHRVQPRLEIAGYSDSGSENGNWWKFDLPPGWEKWTKRSLVEVCGFQWRSAHESILRYREETACDSLQVRFEDIVGSTEVRTQTLKRVCAWLDIPFEGGVRAAAEIMPPPVMATSSPRGRRWFDKAERLEPVLALRETEELVERLGYAQDPDEWV